MTERKVYIGSVGPFLFEDDDLISDVDGDFSGEYYGSVATNAPPISDSHVVRLIDLNDIEAKSYFYALVL